MEFNVLPRARILSPQSRVKTHQSTNQTVNVILPQQLKPINEAQPISRASTPPPESTTNDDSKVIYPPREPGLNPYQDLQPGEVEYITRDVNLNEPAEKLNKEDSIATINFLKLLLQAHLNNPIKYNGYVICSVPVLENLIETLTSCDDCSIETADIESGCCGTTTPHIVPINKIWVNTNGSQEIFKYKYSQFIQTFEEYHISLKFACVD